MKSFAVDRGCTPALKDEHETRGVLSLFSCFSFDISSKTSCKSLGLEGVQSVKIRKTALGQAFLVLATDEGIANFG